MAELGGKSKKKSAARVSRRPKYFLLLSVALCFALFTGLGLWYVYGKANTNKQLQDSTVKAIGTGEQVSGRVETLSSDQQQQLADMSVDAHANLDRAYAKAVALSARGEHGAALKLYEQIAASGKTPYYLYVDYALTASRAGDNARAAELMKTAIERLEGDASLSAELKASKKRALEGKLAGFEEATR